jgi:uncharacterized protein YneF (UPF0154 family)
MTSRFKAACLIALAVVVAGVAGFIFGVLAHQAWKKKLRPNVRLNENQETALTSLAFNIGNEGFPSIIDAINRGESTEKVAGMFTNYSNAGGVFSPAHFGRRVEEGSVYGTPVDDSGSGIIQAAATGGATAYEQGLGDLTKNVQIMSDAATKISPDQFKKVIDASSETLGKTLGELNAVINNLSGTVKELNSATKARLQTGSTDQE